MIFKSIVLHNFARPLRQRLEDRKFCGPYYFTPPDASDTDKGIGFYCGKSSLQCAPHGSRFDLRLELANDHLPDSRLSYINGYYCDADGDGDTLTPIIARLPRGRGFLAGWTMGAQMCAAIDRDIYDNPEDAARAAHDCAERDAEKNRDAQEEERRKEEEEAERAAAEADEEESDQ